MQERKRSDKGYAEEIGATAGKTHEEVLASVVGEERAHEAVEKARSQEAEEDARLERDEEPSRH